MNKIFFFDIDGTLAIHGNIPQSNLEALKRLKEKGYFTFICTGRAAFYAQHMFQDIVSGYIACNGRYITYQGEKLHGEAFSQEELTQYKKQINHLNLGALFVSDDQSYAYHLTPQQLAESQKEYGQSHITCDDTNLTFYTFDLLYQNLEQRDIMIETFSQQLIINDHGGHGSCDCSTIGFDKGSAIAYLLKHFAIDKDHAYAFGDGYNDQAMFREVNHRIAMGNAVDVLKEKATYVTDCIDHDGIMKALQHEHIL